MSPAFIWPYQVHQFRHCFIKRIVLQIYPNCLLQSLNLGNSQFPSPIGSYTSSISKKVYWSHFTLQSRHTELAEEFNSFAIGIFFRRRSERSLPPHQIEELRIILGYQWPNLYYWIKEDLVVHTPSRGSSATGVTASGTTTPVDLSSEEEVEELHKIPLPPDPLPDIPGLLSVSNINWRTEELHQRIEAHNQSLREQPSTPCQHLAALLTHIRSRVNLDELAFTEGNITYHQLRRIDQSSNPHLYTEASLQEDAAYEPPCYQDDQDKGEVEEEVEEEEQEPLPILLLLRIQLATPHSEYNSQGSSLERLRESLDEHCGMLIETTFWLPESPESDWFQVQKQKHKANHLVHKTFFQSLHVPGRKTRQKTGLHSLMDVQTWGHRSSIFSFFWQYSTLHWTFTFFIILSQFDSFSLVK